MSVTQTADLRNKTILVGKFIQQTTQSSDWIMYDCHTFQSEKSLIFLLSLMLSNNFIQKRKNNFDPHRMYPPSQFKMNDSDRKGEIHFSQMNSSCTARDQLFISSDHAVIVTVKTQSKHFKAAHRGRIDISEKKWWGEQREAFVFYLKKCKMDMVVSGRRQLSNLLPTTWCIFTLLKRKLIKYDLDQGNHTIQKRPLPTLTTISRDAQGLTSNNEPFSLTVKLNLCLWWVPV